MGSGPDRGDRVINGAVVSRGGLLPREILDRLGARGSDLPGTDPTDYGLVASERIADAVSRSWNRLVPLWAELAATLEASALPANDRHATTLTRDRWLRPLLEELGFARSEFTRGEITVEDRSYPVSHLWGASVPVHQLGAEVPLDRRTPGVPGAASKSPHGLVQEFLNRSPAHLWGIVTNGRLLRVLRDNVSLTRQAYLEFDLERIFSDNSYSDFTVLWLCGHATRFAGDPPSQCLLEQWNTEAARAGTRALDRLRDGVETAIKKLGEGFLAHRDNADLRRRLREGELAADDYLRALLRTVYRLLFLLVTESRDLLLDPTADEAAQARYRAFYSMERLRTLAVRQRGSPHRDLWEQHRVVARALGHEDGAPAIGITPLGGDLWSEEFVSALGDDVIDNHHLLAAVRALCSVRDHEARVTRPVDYRNLGVEELGSIYESLLELHAEIGSGPQPSFDLAAAAGSERKTTGSYYTPSSLIDRLLDSALDPVMDEAQTADDPEAGLLALRVLDPACGSGHFLIAAAHRIANRLAAVRSGEEEPNPEMLRHALRQVIGHCVYGIDKNPMAVELCKVSLWLEAMEPGRPLNFLDHHVVCGNSLLGTTPRLLADGVPNEAFKALTGDDKEQVSALRKANRAERKQRMQGMLAWDLPQASYSAELRRAFAVIDSYSDESVRLVRQKESEYRDLQESEFAVVPKLAADAWCAAFVVSKTANSPAITDRIVRVLAGAPGSVDEETIEEINRLADEYQFLHLHLAFPDIFSIPRNLDDATNKQCGWSGGFTCVLGNPPWDQIQYDPRETFAVSHPEIAIAPTMAARNAFIDELASLEPQVHERYLGDVRHLDGLKHFIHASNKYPLGSVGRLNTAPLFVEIMWDTISPAGRVGAITPTGIATDSFTQSFFNAMIDRQSLVSLYDFENRKKFFNIDSRMKFSLLTLTGDTRPAQEVHLLFFAHDISDLDDTRRRFTLSPADFRLINPNTRTCPIFRNHRDAQITKTIYRRTPVLIREFDPITTSSQPGPWGYSSGNPWNAQFQLMFMMNTDSGLFHTRTELESKGWELCGNIFRQRGERYLPLYEAKMVTFFDHRAADVVKSPTARVRQNQPRYIPNNLKQDPCRVAYPESWISADEFHSRNSASYLSLLGFKDITSATNERTLICTIIPPTAVGATIPLIHVSNEFMAALNVVLCSYLCDFVARQKVGGNHINAFFMKQLAVLPPNSVLPANSFVNPRVLELAFTAWDLTGFARNLGYLGPPFRWDDERRALMRAELDALMFHLYGIDRDDVDYIMGTFPIVERKDRERYDGAYRTKDLILDRYDALAPFIPPAASPTTTPQLTPDSLNGYQTFLDPPPADPSVAHPASTRPPWA